MEKLNKAAVFGDIHWGAKAGSEMHNLDCTQFIDWFCHNVRNDPSIDHIIFLGDWFNNRSSVNIATLNHAYYGAKKLNSLGIPVFFIIGNHDLYHRHTRDIHSVIPFSEFSNFTIINEPTIVEYIGDGVLLCPYLFHEEYSDLVKFVDYKTWWGHFEFKGFVITGYNITMPTGPDPKDFNGPKHIISGHFHKRQANGNVVYVGNTFPMNFGDAGDAHRGMMTYDHEKDEMLFFDWEDCPKYTKTTLTELLDGKAKLYDNSRIKCSVDVPISFEESSYIRKTFMEKHNLREFTLEESLEISEVLSETETCIDWDKNNLAGVNDLVIQMLQGIDSKHIENEKLVRIYHSLKV